MRDVPHSNPFSQGQSDIPTERFHQFHICDYPKTETPFLFEAFLDALLSKDSICLWPRYYQANARNNEYRIVLHRLSTGKLDGDAVFLHVEIGEPPCGTRDFKVAV